MEKSVELEHEHWVYILAVLNLCLGDQTVKAWVQDAIGTFGISRAEDATLSISEQTKIKVLTRSG